MLYRLDGVGVSFAGRPVLRGLTHQHNPGEKLILLGRNGSGKTTLLRVISGELEPEIGVVERSSGLQVSRLEQIPSGSSATCVLDYCLEAFGAMLGIESEIARLEGDEAGDPHSAAMRLHELREEYERLDGYRLRPRAEAALQTLGVPAQLHRRQLAELSGGQRTRVALVRALLSPGLLLLDEPTNHLDLLGVDFLATELAVPGRPIVLVTHDRDLVDRVGGEVLELSGGRLERYPSGWARYRRERTARRERHRKAYELQQAEIRRQEEFVRRNMAGQNTRQAQSRQKLLERMERIEAPEPDPSAARVRWPILGRSGDRVVEVQGLAAGWGSGVVVRDVSFVLRRGERLAVVGRNGSGKTTLVRTLAGELTPLAGGFRFGTGVVPGWYDQTQADVATGGSVLDVLLASRPEWSPADARSWAGRFAFSGEAADASTTSLSGGERARLALAALLAAAPNLLLLDEPTNHLDADTCEALESALGSFPGGLLLVSHDRRLLERTCTGALFVDGGRVEALERVEDAFERVGLAPTVRRAAGGQIAARRSSAEEERRRLRKDTSRAREQADALAAELSFLEARLVKVDELLCAREVFSDPERARVLGEEADTLRTGIEELFATWSEAEEDATVLEERLAGLDAGD